MDGTQQYLTLLPIQNQAQPNFVSMVVMTCQPFTDTSAMLATLPSLFDLDYATGQQLDIIGQWVGASRNLTTPIAGVYFAWDTPNVGWDEGEWKTPNDPASGVVSLPDESFRSVLKARILNNHWDGSIPDAYSLMNSVFLNLGYSIAIKDNSDLTIDLILVGPTVPDEVMWSLFSSGILDIKPVGVSVASRTYSATSDLLDSTFVLDSSTLL